MYLHAFIYQVIAGGNQPFFSFNFHTAYPAGANFIDFLQIAQRRNGNAGFYGSFHDGGALRHTDSNSVDDYIYHCLIRPPLKLP